ncbi:MAG TPA: Tad domain-containing protein [Terriglobales bacterium]|nr:Tad domain-containing protein [Terriglobales bacterium]
MRGRSRNRERGMTIVMLAVFLVVLFAMAALAVDLGFAYTARTSAQHAADAGALAGAYTFAFTGLSQPGAAIDAARAAAQANYVLGAPATIAATDVTVDIPNRRVTVTVPRSGTSAISTVFARVLGIRSLDVVARATAEALSAGSGSRCVKPVFLPTTILSPNNPVTACNNGERIFDSNGNITSFAQSQLGTCHEIRPTDPNDEALQNPLAPGQFYSLDFGAGADAYRCTWAGCLNQCPSADEDIIECGNDYPLKTGDMVGPVQQGVTDLIGDPADTWWSSWSPTNQQYVNEPSKTLVVDTPSLVLAPVYDNCAQVINSGTAGQRVVVIGFVTIFVDGLGPRIGCPGGGGRGGGINPNERVAAHLVGITTCAGVGGGGAGAGGSVSGPGGYPIRLIQTPTT